MCLTSDRREHHVNDRPRTTATRTAIAIAAISFWGILWAEGANDVIAAHLDISLYVTTEIAATSSARWWPTG
jgi:ubiquinol-cytochrome c reductase cytochrome b subunit